VGAAAHNVSLGAGFAIIGVVYALAFVSSSWPIQPQVEAATAD
jgi:xanthosine utilization system XapX-like protein